MPKKESTKRGYMTLNEIEEHLKRNFPLVEVSDELPIDEAREKMYEEHNAFVSRIDYLERVLKHKGMLSQKTTEGVYEKLAETYHRIGLGTGDEYQKAMINAGKGNKLAENLEDRSNFAEAGKIRKELKEFKKAAEDFEQAAKRKEQMGWVWTRPGTPSQESLIRKFYQEASEMYIKAGEKEKAIQTREKAERYEKKLQSRLSSIIAIAGLVGAGVFFLSPNLTGNVIGNLSNQSSNYLGVSLLLIGLIAGFFWANKSRKKEVNVSKKKSKKKR